MVVGEVNVGVAITGSLYRPWETREREIDYPHMTGSTFKKAPKHVPQGRCPPLFDAPGVESPDEE